MTLTVATVASLELLKTLKGENKTFRIRITHNHNTTDFVADCKKQKENNQNYASDPNTYKRIKSKPYTFYDTHPLPQSVFIEGKVPDYALFEEFEDSGNFGKKLNGGSTNPISMSDMVSNLSKDPLLSYKLLVKIKSSSKIDHIYVLDPKTYMKCDNAAELNPNVLSDKSKFLAFYYEELSQDEIIIGKLNQTKHILDSQIETLKNASTTMSGNLNTMSSQLILSLQKSNTEIADKIATLSETQITEKNNIASAAAALKNEQEQIQQSITQLRNQQQSITKLGDKVDTIDNRENQMQQTLVYDQKQNFSMGMMGLLFFLLFGLVLLYYVRRSFIAIGVSEKKDLVPGSNVSNVQSDELLKHQLEHLSYEVKKMMSDELEHHQKGSEKKQQEIIGMIEAQSHSRVLEVQEWDNHVAIIPETVAGDNPACEKLASDLSDLKSQMVAQTEAEAENHAKLLAVLKKNASLTAESEKRMNDKSTFLASKADIIMAGSSSRSSQEPMPTMYIVAVVAAIALVVTGVAAACYCICKEKSHE